MKYQFIDNIRGIAILMVILVHTAVSIQNLDRITDVFTKYCQMGVQLFFVASAYTLCLSSQNRNHEEHSLLNYGIRRIFRIMPIYWLGIVLYLFISSLNIYDIKFFNEANYTTVNLLANFLFIHGFVEPANNNIVPGGWSIATEMTFYLLFPVIFKFANYFIKSYKYIFLFIIIAIVVSQILVIGFSRAGLHLANNTFLYYSIVNQLPCFCIGIGYFFYLKHGTRKYAWYWDLVGFCLLTIICLLLWSLKIGYLFSWTPILSSLSFVFLIEMFRKNAKLNSNMLAGIGKVSFSMYLFHFIFAYGIDFLPYGLKSHGIASLSLCFPVVVALSYLVGKISYMLIEKPFMATGKSLINRVNKKLKSS